MRPANCPQTKMPTFDWLAQNTPIIAAPSIFYSLSEATKVDACLEFKMGEGRLISLKVLASYTRGSLITPCKALHVIIITN